MGSLAAAVLTKTRLLVLALAVVASCHKSQSTPPARETKVGEVWIEPAQMVRSGIELQAVDEAPMEDTLLTSGKIAFDDARVSHVFSPVSGRVSKITAVLGENVKKGQALAVIESPEIGSASSDVGKAQADLIASEHAFARQERLFRQGATSQTEYEISQDNYMRARAELERAKQRARLMGTGTEVTQSFVLRSEIAGEVVMRAISPGMEVQSQYSVGSALELFTIGTIDKVWVLADVYEIDALRVKTKATTRVRVIALADEVFEGTLDYVGSMLDPTSRTLKVRCVLDNPKRLLKPEMYATMAISVAPHRSLAVPRDAILRLGDQTVVFLDRGTLPDGRQRLVRYPVSIKERSPTGLVEITRGLSKGDRIAVSGVQILSSLLP